MIVPRLVLAGFGRRAIELVLATLVIATLSAVIASSAAVIEGARAALYRFERKKRPDVIHVIGRFNRALFELPRRRRLAVTPRRPTRFHRHADTPTRCRRRPPQLDCNPHLLRYT
jgi:hypothetical protein